MRAAVVPGFLPSTHGLHFANRWPAGPVFSWRSQLATLGIGDAALGLCGGMCEVVRDRFEHGEAVPLDPVAPAAGTELFREIARRQLDSLDFLVRVPARFWLRSVAATANTTIQLAVPDGLRGRVMAVYTTIFVGSTPFGGLIVGGLASAYGVPAAVAIGGAASALVGAAALVWYRRAIGPEPTAGRGAREVARRSTGPG